MKVIESPKKEEPVVRVRDIPSGIAFKQGPFTYIKITRICPEQAHNVVRLADYGSLYPENISDNGIVHAQYPDVTLTLGMAK